MLMFMDNSDPNGGKTVGGRLACAVFSCSLLVYCAIVSCAWAQGVASTPAVTPSATKPPPSGTPSTTVIPRKASSSKPAWQDLTPTQQVSLKPLAANWNTLSESHKRKWLAIAFNYPTLAPTEQAKLHSRMTEWVALSRQQRIQARLNFAESKQLTPTQKAATWQAYQALSPEEKKKLATSASPKPAGAAAAVKPALPQKLATVPVTRQASKQTAKIAVPGHVVNPNTLLPRTPPTGASTTLPPAHKGGATQEVPVR